MASRTATPAPIAIFFQSFMCQSSQPSAACDSRFLTPTAHSPARPSPTLTDTHPQLRSLRQESSIIGKRGRDPQGIWGEATPFAPTADYSVTQVWGRSNIWFTNASTFHLFQLFQSGAPSLRGPYFRRERRACPA